MNRISTVFLFSTVCLLNSQFALLATASDKISQCQNDGAPPCVQKSKVSAGLIGALGGFGFGDYYAKGHWSASSTVLAVIDTSMAAIIIVYFLLPTDGRNAYWYLGLSGYGALFLGSRTYQGIHAADEVRRIDYSEKISMESYYAMNRGVQIPILFTRF
ncbi:MAG: hypothetical protein ACXVCH_05855 [Bdellovibrionota bacterium]